MTDDTRDPPPGAPRKRPTPTIDLTAKEIPTAPQSGGKTESADQKPHVASAQETADNKKTTTNPSMSVPRQMNVPWPMAIAAAGGAMVIFLIGWGVGIMAGGHDSADDRIARLEAQLRDRSALPADSGLSARIAALEAAIKAAAADAAASRERRNDEVAVIAREARSRAESAATAADSAQKNRASESDAARADLDAMSGRLAAVEEAARSNQSELAKRPAAIDDPKSRLAITASALRDAVERGQPFASELAAAKSLAADPKLLASLDEFAAAGIPTNAALARELSALLPALARADPREKRDRNFLERLQANAEKLVRIRPVGEIAGDEPEQIMTRIEARAAKLDAGGAISELMRLPAAIRAPAEPWIKKIENRNSALNAARQFAQGALAGIGKPGS